MSGLQLLELFGRDVFGEVEREEVQCKHLGGGREGLTLGERFIHRWARLEVGWGKALSEVGAGGGWQWSGCRGEGEASRCVAGDGGSREHLGRSGERLVAGDSEDSLVESYVV